MSTLLALCNELLRRTGQTEVATLANASSPATQARDFINEIYTDMLQTLKVNRLVKKGSLTTVAGTAAYDPAADTDINGILADSMIETQSQTILKAVDYTYPLEHGQDATGRPDAFYRQDSSIMLHPTPDAAYALEYHYLVTPQPLSLDADTTLLPQAWEKVLLRGAQALLEAFLGDGGRDSYALYKEGLDHLKAEARLKPVTRMRGYYRGWPGIDSAW